MSEPQIDIENLIQQDKERLSQQIDEAIKHAPNVQVVNGIVINEEQQTQYTATTEVPPGMAHLAYTGKPNNVYLEAKNSHLFPWLYGEGLKRTGQAASQERIKSIANHEFSHLANAQGIEGTTSRIGVSFYKVTSVDGTVLPQAANAVQANVSVEGMLLIEELKDIMTAPNEDMSPGDERDINNLNNAIKQ